MAEKKYIGSFMRVAFSIGSPPATMRDGKVTKETIEAKSAAYGSGVWNTKLWGRMNIPYHRIQRIVIQARAAIKASTLRTSTRGERLVKTQHMLDLKALMKTYEEKYWEACRSFIARYDEVVAQEKTRLGDLANSIVYPDKEEMKRRFKFEVEFSGIPSGQYILDAYSEVLGLSGAGELAKEMEDNIKKELRSAELDAWRKIFSAIHSMAEKLTDADKEFRNSLIDNIKGIVSVIPALNIADDDRLNKIKGEIESKLLKYSASTLRKSKAKRAEVASDAVQIVNSMATMFIGRDEADAR